VCKLFTPVNDPNLLFFLPETKYKWTEITKKLLWKTSTLEVPAAVQRSGFRGGDGYAFRPGAFSISVASRYVFMIDFFVSLWHRAVADPPFLDPLVIMNPRHESIIIYFITIPKI